jgi:hypothetical protein
MLEGVKWKIFYDDGTTVSSDSSKPEEAPVDGILAIVEKKGNNTIMVHQNNEYYYWTGENWISGGLNSLERWLRKELPNLKYGRWTKESVWRQVLEEADKWR